MAKDKINVQLTTDVFRISFPHLFKPYAPKGSANEPKYSCDMLFTDKAAVEKIQKACAQILTQKFGSDKTKWPKLKYPVIKDGNEKENITGYEGTKYVTARSNSQPTVVDRDKQEILEERTVYAGAYCRAQISLYWYEMAGNKGIGVGLNAVQFVKDGPSFGAGKVNVNAAFGDDLPDDGADDPANYGNETDDTGF